MGFGKVIQRHQLQQKPSLKKKKKNTAKNYFIKIKKLVQCNRNMRKFPSKTILFQ